MLAQRIAVQHVLPGGMLVVTATRAAGSRFLIAGLIVVNLILAIVLVCEKTFGLKKRLQQTLMIKSTIEDRLDRERGRESMLQLVLRKSRRNLGSLSSIDDDDDDDDDDDESLNDDIGGRSRGSRGSRGGSSRRGKGAEDRGGSGVQASASCPLCHGTGKIVYEGKLRHEDPCPRCAMILGTH
jgi:hypothetical protein